jgi:hypothetical protein
MIVCKTLLLAAIAIDIFLFGYLIVLIGRTDYLEKSTSIGFDVIAIFHGISVTVILSLIIGLQNNIFKKWILLSALSLSIMVEVAFFGLNVTGNVWQHEKSTPTNLIDLVREEFI